MASFLAKHWFLCFLVIAVGSALLAPAVLHPLVDFWEPRPTIAISLFLMAWTMPTHSLIAEVKSPWASIWAVALTYGIVPLVAWLIGFAAPEDVQKGLILVSVVPCTLASAILWTRMAGGNEATALLTVLGTTFTSWFLTTAWLYLLTGTQVEINFTAMMIDLVFSLIVPVVLGQAIRFIPWFERTAERRKVLISGIAQCFVVAIVLKAGVTVGDKLHAQTAQSVPAIFAWSIGLAISLHLFALVSGYWSCRWLGFDRGRQIAVAFSASQKTLQVSLLLYDQYYRDYAFAVMPLLFYHVGQLLLDTVIARRMHAGPPAEDGSDVPRLE